MGPANRFPNAPRPRNFLHEPHPSALAGDSDGSYTTGCDGLLDTNASCAISVADSLVSRSVRGTTLSSSWSPLPWLSDKDSFSQFTPLLQLHPYAVPRCWSRTNSVPKVRWYFAQPRSDGLWPRDRGTHSFMPANMSLAWAQWASSRPHRSARNNTSSSHALIWWLATGHFDRPFHPERAANSTGTKTHKRKRFTQDNAGHLPRGFLPPASNTWQAILAAQTA